MAEPSTWSELRDLRAVVVNWRDPAHHLAGGSERYAWEIAAALRDAGASVEFVTSRDSGQSARDVVDGIRVRRAGGRFTVYLWTLMLMLLRRRRTDLVIDVENGIPSFSPLVLRRSTPVVLVMHHVHLDQFGSHFPRPVAAWGRLLERRLMPLVYRRCQVQAVSGSTRDEMVTRLGWSGPIEVVFNGADLRGMARSEPEPRRVAVLGRLVAHKRIHLVVEAAAALRDRGEPIMVDVIGRGPREESLRRLVMARGLTDVVRLHGFVDEQTKAHLLARAELHVCASEGEGWGQVVLEAAAAGVPTVAYDVPGLRDSVLPGRSGWLLQRGERLEDGITKAFAELRETPQSESGRAEAIRADCRAWADQFTWDEMRRRSLQVATAVLGERHQRSSTYPSGVASALKLSWRELLRSVRLFSSFRTEQADPAGFYRLIADDALALIDRVAPVSGRTVVDIGGGPGHYTAAFRSAGACCLLMDIDLEEIAVRGPDARDTVVGTAAQLPLRDGSVDIVFTSNMLEHVRDPDLVRNELVRVLRPGGHLVLSYTNWLSPWGGHETSPWHYLGGRYAARRYARVHGVEPKNDFGKSLFAISVADGLRWARSRTDLRLLEERPRYLPRGARFVLHVPGLRELVTWNLWQVFEKEPVTPV
jgi:glycosyltransferase involved in cell wall biosynthesis/SAM-dependent methyltransferase